VINVKRMAIKEVVTRESIVSSSERCHERELLYEREHLLLETEDPMHSLCHFFSLSLHGLCAWSLCILSVPLSLSLVSLASLSLWALGIRRNWRD
jgi:hypothetical protein